MTTRTDIVNRALSAIAARSSLVNLNERSTEAEQARLLYDPTRDELLRAAPWNFARKMVQLALLKAAPGTPENPTGTPNVYDPATMPPPPWFYSYAYPNDCVQVRMITSLVAQPGFDQPMFSVALPAGYAPGAIVPSRFAVAADTDNSGNQVKVVLTNRASALCLYTQRIEIEDLWDPLFQEAMVQSLATRFAMPISGKQDIARARAQGAMNALQTARSRDGNEGTTSVDFTPDWIAVRGYSGAILGDDGVGASNQGWWTPSFLLF
jgi:hypothetical protein